MPGFRFDADEVRLLGGHGLLAEQPAESLDLAVEARRGDDDLNPHARMIGLDGAPTRLAAVLVPIVARDPEVTVLLTLRTEHMASHAGQVAFPGGKLDEVDHGSAVAAALREAEEETGLAPGFVEPLGFLDAYQTRTGYRIVPVVGLVRPGFELRPEPREVAAVFEVPLSFLMDPANHRLDSRVWQGIERKFYAMPFADRYIWGATAGMIRNLYERLYRP